MTNITVYDYIAEKLDKAAEQLDTTVAEVVEQLVDDYLEEITD